MLRPGEPEDPVARRVAPAWVVRAFALAALVVVAALILLTAWLLIRWL